MLSYSQALEAGLDPIQYRTEYLDSLSVGEHTVVVDGVVWARRKPAAIALVRDKDGHRIGLVKVKEVNLDGLEYGGITEFMAGELAILEVYEGRKKRHGGRLTKMK